MSTYPTLFKPFGLGSIELKNRAVMAPMTRSRAPQFQPNLMMAQYYAQRASAGLIITEGTAPHPHGIGYPRTPGLFNEAQRDGWKEVTQAVHDRGGAIFLQIMHVGRVAHPHNQPPGARIVAPSPIVLDGNIHTDQQGRQPHPIPTPMTEEDIEEALTSFARSATLAIDAGFDGVELHGANGYLLEQFLHPSTNQRMDRWGGNPQARNRFVVEAAKRCVDAIGQARVGIRLSPFGVANGMPAHFGGAEGQYHQLIRRLSELGLVYLHLVDHSTMGAPALPSGFIRQVRAAFAGALVLSGGYGAPRAELDLEEGLADLIAFGRPFIANPDLLDRFAQDAPINEPLFEYFYSGGAKGYLDYPTLPESR